MTSKKEQAKAVEPINPDTETNLICEIDHPLFDLIGSVTRRQVLRLIACEHNYGNRIASILDVSTPAIHRHLKYLEGKNPGDLSLIREKGKVSKSYSGHKGGEATLYQVKTKIGLFFNIMPNFVHSHILELNEDNEEVIREEQMVPEHLRDLKLISSADLTESDENRKKMKQLYKTVQKYNKRILELEKEILDVLSIKNEFMGEVDSILKSEENLEYEDRVILRAITCLGERCSSDLTHFLSMDHFELSRYVDRLRKKGWLQP